MIIFKLLTAIILLFYVIKYFILYFNNFIDIVAVSEVNASETRPFHHFLFLNTEGNKFEIWDVGMLINTQWCLNFSFILFFLVMYLNPEAV